MRDDRLEKLAEVLVNYSTKVKKGDRVAISAEDAALPFIKAVAKAAVKQGALVDYYVDMPDVDAEILKCGTEEQYARENIRFGACAKSDVWISAWGSENTKTMQSIDGERLKQKRLANSMKRILTTATALGLATCMIGTTVYAAEEKKTAIPNVQEVVLDGHSEMMQCYNIDGYNYFRLRDVAEQVTEHIKNTMHLFDVGYNPEARMVYIETDGRKYTKSAEAKEYVIGTAEKEAVPPTTRVFVDGHEMTQSNRLEGYVIDGYTFYKLRDLADLIQVDVEWCEAEQVIELVSLPWEDQDGNPIAYRKPIIYLYPEETTDVSVNLEYDGELAVTYPAYNDGWKVTAQPDGTLTNQADGREYSYLFWEGEGYGEMDFSEGFCVKGEDTVSFLQEKLAAMGMTPKEYNEFIVYWLPYMQDNPYNLISFQWENYEEAAKLHITPEPDNMLRVFMAFKPLEQPVEVPKQKLPTLEREGFTVVEWGGTEVH